MSVQAIGRTKLVERAFYSCYIFIGNKHKSKLNATSVLRLSFYHLKKILCITKQGQGSHKHGKLFICFTSITIVLIQSVRFVFRNYLIN